MLFALKHTRFRSHIKRPPGKCLHFFNRLPGPFFGTPGPDRPAIGSTGNSPPRLTAHDFRRRSTLLTNTSPASLRPLLSVLLAGMIALTAAGQTARAQDVDSTLVGRFQLAETFMQAAQFERAIGLLEDLYDRSPETHVFYERLRQAYESVKRYDAAIALVDSKIEAAGNPGLFLVEKGRLLFLKGDEATARETWQSAVDRNPRTPGTYLMVYRSLLDVRLFDLAIDILEQGRENIGAPDLFQTDLAQLYNLTGQHAEAMDEYLGLLAVNQAQLSFVRSRLSEHLTDEEALTESIERARQAVATDPLNRSYRELLAWLYVEDGQYRAALDVYRAVDRLEKEEGSVLFAFAQVAADGGAYDVALEAYEEILARYPDAQTAPEAMRGLGLMQEKWAVTLGEQPIDTLFINTFSQLELELEIERAALARADQDLRVQFYHLDPALHQSVKAVRPGHEMRTVDREHGVE